MSTSFMSTRSAAARVARIRVTRNQRWLAGILVAFVTFWEVGARVGFINTIFTSTPTAIAAAVPVLARESLVTSALATTGQAMVWAAVWGIVAGAFLGYLMGFFPSLRLAFMGWALYLLSVPKSIFIPIFLALFGVNTRTAVIYGAFSGFIYVLVNVVSGFDLIESRHLRVAKAFGASTYHRIVDVILPASIPGLFNGIWYGLKSGLQGVLIMELFVSIGGLGRMIRLYTNDMETDRVMALILSVSLVAILVGQVWSWLEGRLAKWRPQEI